MPKKKKMRRENGTGSVSYLGGKKPRRKPYMARAFDKTGKRIIIGYFASRDEAELALASNLVKPLPPKASITLKQLYEEWSKIKYTDDLSKDTINNYKAGWKYLVSLQNETFREIRAGQYQAIIDSAGENKSRSTLEKIKTVAVMLSTYAMENDIIDKNYGSFIKLPKATRSIKTSFTDIEINLIEQAAKNGTPFADCILMMCYTGFRITEFLSLTQFSYDSKQDTLIGGIKTEAGKDRVIPVHPKIKPFLLVWLDKKGERIICKPDGKRYTSKYFRENCFAPALEQIEGVRNLDPHECRHTFASLLHSAEVSQKEIMELMGHDDPEVDLKTYIHVDVERLRNAVQSI
jgi:integrase/recombinase XerD